MSSDQPYTDAELEAGARAVGRLRHFIDADGYPSIRICGAEDEARVVLEAVLPLHAARIRRETAEGITAAIWRECERRHPARVDALTAADIAHAHATTKVHLAADPCVDIPDAPEPRGLVPLPGTWLRTGRKVPLHLYLHSAEDLIGQPVGVVYHSPELARLVVEAVNARLSAGEVPDADT